MNKKYLLIYVCLIVLAGLQAVMMIQIKKNKACFINIRSYGRNDEEGRLLGIGREEKGQWVEYVTVRSRSSAYDADGHPSIRLNNMERDTKSVELGFYNFGPTLYTKNEIIEFFIGDSRTGAEYGSFSVRSIDLNFGARIEVRDTKDTGAILLENRKDEFDIQRIKTGAKPVSLIKTF